MEQIFVRKNEDNEKLILIFGGWSSDDRLFGYTPPSGYDMMVCFDYSDMSFDVQEIQHYSQISLMAWSLGVWIAEKVLSPLNVNWETRIAVNGTQFPIDDDKGIPQNIFDGTIENFSTSTLYKFRRRMCGSSDEMEKFMEHGIYRDERSLIEELTALRSYIMESKGSEQAYVNEETGLKDSSIPETNKSHTFWDKAIIGNKDRIFPPENQEKAWSGTTVTEKVDIAHYNDEFFRTCIDTLCRI